MERKLAAILHADVKGYSRLMGEDEEATLRTLTAYRDEIDAIIRQHRGRVVGSAGDSVLAEFASVVDAVQCAVVIQATLKAENASLSPQRKMEFRIGINLGDVMVQGEQIYGDGVNIAARLESLAEPGGIYISGTVYEQVKNKLTLEYEYLGEQQVKNIAEPVRVWRIRVEESGSPGSGVRSPESKVESQKPRRVGMAHRHQVVVAVVGLLLIVGTIVAVRYFFRPPLSPQSSVLVTQAEPTPALPLPDKPSIVVLPFTNISGDPEQEYFSDGVTEDIITDLSKISGLFIIARNSAFTYKGKAVMVQEVGRELGVRHVLEGSVRKAGDQVRITAQLVDATTGGHVWSERYDRPLTDLFVLQDEITQKIVLALKVELLPEEQERLRLFPTGNLEAHDYSWRGAESFWRLSKEDNLRARQMFEKAIALDPTFATAYVNLSATYWVEWTFQWSQDPQALERAFALAQHARDLDDSLHYAHQMLGLLYAQKGQYDLAIAEAQRAVMLAPNWALNYAALGIVLRQAGKPGDAIESIEKGIRLDPHFAAYTSATLGMAYYLAGRYDEALTTLKRHLARYPTNPTARLYLAATYSETSQEDAARAEAAEILRVNPQFSLEVWRQRTPFKDHAAQERLFNALRKAGLK
jgi:adenylate cyclase